MINARISHNLLFGLVLLMFFAAPVFAHAASIYFAPASGSYKVGEQFSVNIFVSSDGQEINAADATISTTDNKLQLVSVPQAGSIIDFWAQEPQISGGGSVSFEGVMLGGGYSGSSGKLATIVVRARSEGNASLSIRSGTVLANDGQGTVLSTNLGTARFSIGPSAAPLVVETVPDDFVFTKELRQGDSGKEVTSLQTCLRDRGFYAEDITGYFGAQTKQAVIDFQEFYYDDILAPWGFTKGTGLVSDTTREKLNSICFTPTEEEILEQLFDISVELDDISIDDADDLLARVMFASFGEIPTSVDLTFRILDEIGEEAYVSKDAITVETEAVFTKEFKYLDLPVGKYTLEATTLYDDTDVGDTFYVEFEVFEAIEGEIFGLTFLTDYRFWIGVNAFFTVIIILLLIILVLLIHRAPLKYRENHNKQMLSKEEAILRQTQKHLLGTKVKTEQELQKVENKLKRFSEKDDSA